MKPSWGSAENKNQKTCFEWVHIKEYGEILTRIGKASDCDLQLRLQGYLTLFCISVT